MALFRRGDQCSEQMCAQQKKNVVEILQSLPEPLLLDWKPKCHHPGNWNSNSCTMLSLSNKGKDKVMNLIKVTTVPIQGWAPRPHYCWDAHFSCVALSHVCAAPWVAHVPLERLFLQHRQEGACCRGAEKKAGEILGGKSAPSKPSLVRLHVKPVFSVNL